MARQRGGRGSKKKKLEKTAQGEESSPGAEKKTDSISDIAAAKNIASPQPTLKEPPVYSSPYATRRATRAASAEIADPRGPDENVAASEGAAKPAASKNAAKEGSQKITAKTTVTPDKKIAATEGTAKQADNKKAAMEESEKIAAKLQKESLEQTVDATTESAVAPNKTYAKEASDGIAKQLSVKEASDGKASAKEASDGKVHNTSAKEASDGKPEEAVTTDAATVTKSSTETSDLKDSSDVKNILPIKDPKTEITDLKAAPLSSTETTDFKITRPLQVPPFLPKDAVVENLDQALESAVTHIKPLAITQSQVTSPPALKRNSTTDWNPSSPTLKPPTVAELAEALKVEPGVIETALMSTGIQLADLAPSVVAELKIKGIAALAECFNLVSPARKDPAAPELPTTDQPKQTRRVQRLPFLNPPYTEFMDLSREEHRPFLQKLCYLMMRSREETYSYPNGDPADVALELLAIESQVELFFYSYQLEKFDPTSGSGWFRGANPDETATMYRELYQAMHARYKPSEEHNDDFPLIEHPHCTASDGFSTHIFSYWEFKNAGATKWLNNEMVDTYIDYISKRVGRHRNPYVYIYKLWGLPEKLYEMICYRLATIKKNTDYRKIGSKNYNETFDMKMRNWCRIAGTNIWRLTNAYSYYEKFRVKKDYPKDESTDKAFNPFTRKVLGICYCSGSHHMLMALCFPERLINSDLELNEVTEDSLKPILYVFDSMTGSSYDIELTYAFFILNLSYFIMKATQDGRLDFQPSDPYKKSEAFQNEKFVFEEKFDRWVLDVFEDTHLKVESVNNVFGEHSVTVNLLKVQAPKQLDCHNCGVFTALNAAMLIRNTWSGDKDVARWDHIDEDLDPTNIEDRVILPFWGGVLTNAERKALFTRRCKLFRIRMIELLSHLMSKHALKVPIPDKLSTLEEAPTPPDREEIPDGVDMRGLIKFVPNIPYSKKLPVSDDHWKTIKQWNALPKPPRTKKRDRTNPAPQPIVSVGKQFAVNRNAGDNSTDSDTIVEELPMDEDTPLADLFTPPPNEFDADLVEPFLATDSGDDELGNDMSDDGGGKPKALPNILLDQKRGRSENEVERPLPRSRGKQLPTHPRQTRGKVLKKMKKVTKKRKKGKFDNEEELPPDTEAFNPDTVDDPVSDALVDTDTEESSEEERDRDVKDSDKQVAEEVARKSDPLLRCVDSPDRVRVLKERAQRVKEFEAQKQDKSKKRKRGAFRNPLADDAKLQDFRHEAKARATVLWRNARHDRKENPGKYGNNELRPEQRDEWENIIYAELVADWELQREKDVSFAKAQRKTEAYQKQLEQWKKEDFPIVCEAFHKVRNKGPTNKKYRAAVKHMEKLFPEDKSEDAQEAAYVGESEEPDGLEIGMARYRPRFHDFKDARGVCRSYFDVRYMAKGQGETSFDVRDYPTPGANGVTPHVTEQWMRWKFSGKWVSMVMAAGMVECDKYPETHDEEVFTPWLLLPVGNPRLRVEKEKEKIEHLRSNVSVKYLQGKEFTCLYNSFASALYYLHDSFPSLNMRNAGYLLSRQAKKVKDMPLPQQVDQLILDVKILVPRFETVLKWKTKKDSMNFDVLNDISDFPTVVIPLGSDGGLQHAFTVVGKLIFDSNSDRALHLTKESLDWCCAVPGGYVKVFTAVRIITTATKFLKRNAVIKSTTEPLKSKRKKKRKKTVPKICVGS